MARPQTQSTVPSNRPPRDDGTKYRLRDREGDPPTVWGDGLTYQEARALRDQVHAQKKSRFTVIESMPDQAAPIVETQREDLSVPVVGQPPVQHHPPIPSHPGTEYQVSSATPPTTLNADGTITTTPPDHHLLVNGQERPVPTRVHKGDVVECRSLAPAAAQARAAAVSAAAQVVQQRRRIPMDVTVRQPTSRRAPPPPDRTVSTKPVVVRLGDLPAMPPKPLPSPLKVAMLQDGEELPPDAITDAELPDIASDLGGGPSDADVEHARKQAEAERTG
jgi:hypothetical protein